MITGSIAIVGSSTGTPAHCARADRSPRCDAGRTAVRAVRASGDSGRRRVRVRHCDVRAAQAALRSGSVPIVLGAVPFDVDRPAALLVPDAVRRTDALPDWPTGTTAGGPHLSATRRGRLPHPHRPQWIGSPRRAAPAKVVLARAWSWPPTVRSTRASSCAGSPPPIRPLRLSRRPHLGRRLLPGCGAGGASRNCWSRARATAVMCHRSPVRPPSADPETRRRQRGTRWRVLPRTATEHQLVIDTMRAALEPLCDDLTISPEPN